MYKRLFFTGVIYGLSIALMLGGVTALCTFLSGLEFQEALVLGAQISALMLPTAIGACILALIAKEAPEEEEEEEICGSGIGEQYPDEPQSPIDTVFERLLECAWLQIELTYRNGISPTRKYVTTKHYYTQPEWNSSRALLVALGIVTGQQWVTLELPVLYELIKRVRLDKHSESAGIIFVPSASSRIFQRLPIALPPINGSYLTAPPQPPGNSRFPG